ncbi:FecR family protein [Chitinophaga sp. LS1]|uniref:FecR family protein n=1 Tax=Chitinophaga sp. LS1 TaxID=3051176 RepID=UPI002AAC1B7E|nr:FecR domain-containing protein [Chitinophaga sp. LS1]WPV70028.1 FecR domain-containing protein [Chitinophaga sp. LS1]
MQNRKEYFKHLLHNKNWTQEDRVWFLQYLNEKDLTELQEFAAAEYNADLFTAEPILAREDSERILKNIHQRIAVKPQPIVRRLWWRAAAAAMLILAAGIGYYKVSHPPVKELIVLSGEQRKKVTLPDGSKVFLEPRSSLKYKGDYGKAEREVALSGEALFDVQHDNAHPFIVASPLINTRVLGTSFNIEARDAREAKVVVLTGMVQVQAIDGNRNDGQEVILTANKRAVYNKTTDQLQMSDASDDARFYLQKQQGRFVYDGTELIKVVNDLQRYYNINVTVDKRLQHCAFYGDFNTIDEPEKALNVIALSLNARINKDSAGNGFNISGGSCQ